MFTNGWVRIKSAVEWVFFDVRGYDWGKRRYVRVGWHLAGALSGILCLLLAVVLGGIATDRHFSRQSCEARASAIGTEEYTWYDFTFFDYGCFRVDERGTTTDNYIRILIEE